VIKKQRELINCQKSVFLVFFFLLGIGSLKSSNGWEGGGTFLYDDLEEEYYMSQPAVFKTTKRRIQYVS